MKCIKEILYLVLFAAAPLLMTAGILMAVYSYPEISPLAPALFIPGLLLWLSNKKLSALFDRNMQAIEYDSEGRRKGFEDYSRMSKRERIAVDKQKLAAMERIVSSTALKRMAKPGSADPEGDMAALIGMEGAKTKMRAMAARMEYDRKMAKDARGKLRGGEPESRHMAFSGNPGTGKTTAARIMAGFLYKYGYIKQNRCLETDGNFLKASNPADTAVKTEIILREAEGGVLFIDEAYALAMDAAGEAACATLIKRMEDDRGKVTVILAGYTDEIRKLISLNPGLASRIRDYVEFPDYTDHELFQIFLLMAGRKGAAVTDGAAERFMERIRAERKLPYFGNARTARKIAEEAMDMHALHMKDGTLGEADRYRLTAADVSTEPDRGVFAGIT